MADFEYFYGQEADLFSFIRVPKLLFTDERFRNLTSDAKILYGLLLDRMSLSIDNDWFDEKGRVFIIYTIEEIEKTFGCANGKAGKTLKQLVDAGLVDRTYQGQGKASLLYVKKILSDMSKSHPKTCEKNTSRDAKIASLDMRKSHGINTEINNTDFNNTENNNLISSNLIKIYPPGYKEQEKNDEIRRDEKTDNLSDVAKIKRSVLEHIDADSLKQRFPYNRELIDQIANLMVDVISDDVEYFVIGGAKKNPELVKDQFKTLDYSHVAYVIDSLKSNTTEVRNMRQYLIASLYNAPLTIDAHYESQVAHDTYRGDF